MSAIVCAIRGGPGSQAAIDEAIALAQSRHLPICFLYVVNLDFLSRTATSRVGMISELMREMGESILLPAQDKAGAQGVKAEKVVRQGDVGEEIARLCHEMGAAYLVLGRPKPEKEDNVFTHARLTQFSERLEEQTGAKVILPGEQTS
jgi:nucleotide-binding universal stress UspA family protein